MLFADAVTKSTMFFLAATLLLVAAEVCYFAAHVSHPKHRLCVFIAGVVFIVSGKHQRKKKKSFFFWKIDKSYQMVVSPMKHSV